MSVSPFRGPDVTGLVLAAAVLKTEPPTGADALPSWTKGIRTGLGPPGGGLVTAWLVTEVLA